MFKVKALKDCKIADVAPHIVHFAEGEIREVSKRVLDNGLNDDLLELYVDELPELEEKVIKPESKEKPKKKRSK